ncbi:MAG: glycerophosphodiester phosphodiesterase family protein [Proteobacteria bacterium]|nr:glycerophosphodiester phosphodiesterase family protein [Pseudomonadota bacterium]
MSFDASQLIIGHRGAAGLVPENTLPSFLKAASYGVDAIELDVYWVHDRLWVIHDDTLDRTTNGRGRLADHSVSQILALDAGAGARIPTLEEVLDQLPRDIGINVELKGPGTAQPVCNALSAYPDHDFLISSFDHAELGEFCAVKGGKKHRVAPLFGRWKNDACKTAAGFDAWSGNLSAKAATDERLQEIQVAGFKSLVYTVNDVQVGGRLFEAGASGLFTDYPDRFA